MGKNNANTVQVTGTPSFIGLKSYSEEQSKFFFGRDEEISAVTTLVKSNTLTLVFGKSGTGKTSLLNAGVFPKLRKTYSLPFRVRLEFKEESPDLVAQVKNVLKKEIDKYGFKVASYPSPSETLWEYFHKEPLWKSITPILVFDQFEEIFTIAKDIPRFAGQEILDFWIELSNLIENRIPDSLHELYLNHREQVTYDYKRQPVKVIFSFREEFLPNFESIPSRIPSIKYSRFRLMPMNEKQALEVITKTWGDKIDSHQAGKIITYLTSDEVVTSLTVIEPALLSQICTYLDKVRQDSGSEKISAAFLARFPKETILRSIYDETMDQGNQAVIDSEQVGDRNHPAPGDPRPVNTFLEDNLITNAGYRMEYALKDSDKIYAPGIQVLLAKYFLREEGKMGDQLKSIELTHDVLTPLIKDDREIRRNEMARVAARQKAKKRAWKIVLYSLIGVGLMFLLSLKYESGIVSEIINKTDTLNQIKVVLKDSTNSLNNFRSAIKRERQHYNDSVIKAWRIPGLPAISSDSVLQYISLLSGQIKRLQSDSAVLNGSNASLNTQIAQITANLEIANTQNSSLQANVTRLNGSNQRLSGDLEKLNMQYQLLGSRLVDRDRQYDSLVDLYLRLIVVYHPPPPPATPCDAMGSDSSMVNLVLKYEIPEKDKNGKKVIIPPNLTVYLIPDIPANKRIIKNASVFEIRTNEPLLKTATGYQVAQYCSGRYLFHHVPKGKYLIKVCTYYGGYKIYDKKVPGSDVVSVEIAPPIR